MPTKAEPTDTVETNEFDEMIRILVEMDPISTREIARLEKLSEQRREQQLQFREIETDLVRRLVRRLNEAERVAEQAESVARLGDLFEDMLDAVDEHLRSYPPSVFENSYRIPESLRVLKDTYDQVVAKRRGDDDEG